MRSELGKVLVQKHLATKKMADESNRHETLQADIQEALKANRDDLAEIGIAEQMDIEARLPVLENTVADCAAQEKELEGFIVALQAKRREMQQAVQDWKQSQTQAATHGKGRDGSTLNQILRNTEKTANAFDRLMGRQTGLHMAGRDPSQLAKLKDLEEVSRTNRIKERLAQLKTAK